MQELAKGQLTCSLNFRLDQQRDILRQSLPMADWYVASGSMNLLSCIETAIFIRRCYEHARKGFVFNLIGGQRAGGGVCLLAA